MKVAALLLTLAIALLCADDAQACSCVSYDAKEQFDRAQFVFVAEVTSISQVNGKFGQEHHGEFNVVHALKGDPTLIQHLASSHAMCLVPISVGEAYLVFTDESGVVAQCSGSIWIDRDVTTVADTLRIITPQVEGPRTPGK